MSLSIDQIPGVWRGSLGARQPSMPTGDAALDRLLGGGWPLGALSELVSEHDGLGLGIVLPALIRLTQAKQPVALIAPPMIPYAPALQAAGADLSCLIWIDAVPEQRFWSAEQLLRGGAGAVLLWCDALPDRAARRLQLAAESRQAVGIAFTPAGAAHSSAPALRMRLDVGHGEIHVDVERHRGRFVGHGSRLSMAQVA